jgi:hypothetical protein
MVFGYVLGMSGPGTRSSSQGSSTSVGNADMTVSELGHVFSPRRSQFPKPNTQRNLRSGVHTEINQRVHHGTGIVKSYRHDLSKLVAHSYVKNVRNAGGKVG